MASRGIVISEVAASIAGNRMTTIDITQIRALALSHSINIVKHSARKS